eukprot:TRINITY_DN20241_c0_g1_i2.p1 TRINITY_DN20241_c0_g1~~TRINITY_DN20241_c0_g1_i2.p1  ORF type:complete len:161 (-),score=50.26 TRINITY_DN20241_c0_g1_i2:60-542(-)
MFTAYLEQHRKKKKDEMSGDAVFPCVLEMVPGSITSTHQPLNVTVRVVEGIARVGTPLVIPSRNFMEIGRIKSLVGVAEGEEATSSRESEVRAGQKAIIQVALDNKNAPQPVYGRHYDARHQLVSKLSRRSIDVLKSNFKDDLEASDWMLVIKLKKVFAI